MLNISMDYPQLESYHIGQVKSWFDNNVIDPKLLRNFARKNTWSNISHIYSEARLEKEKLAEYVFLQEIIWTLVNPLSNEIWSYHDDTFHLQCDITLPGLVGKTTVLERITAAVNDIKLLINFIEAVLYVTFDSTVEDVDKWPVTYEAYANAISDYLDEFNAHLQAIQKNLRPKSGDSVKAFLNKMQLKFNEIHQLCELHSRAIVSSQDPNWHKSARLLSVLFDAAQNSYPPYKYLYYQLFISSFAPFCFIIDKWIQEGQLEDHKMEFPIMKNSDIDVLDENFWSQSYCVHCFAELKQELGYEPLQFLSPFFSKLVEAGKSSDLMNNSDFPADIQFLKHHGFKLYREIRLGSVAELPKPNPKEDEDIFSQAIQSSLLTEDFADDCLLIAFGSELAKMLGTDVIDKTKHDSKIKAFCPVLECPKAYLIARITPIIDNYYLEITSKLTSVFCHDFLVDNHIRNIHLVYLFEAGDVMQPFYGALFDMIISKEPWNDLTLLTNLLEDSLSVKYFDLGHSFTVSCGGLEEPTSDVLDSLKRIKINYRITWPLSIILSEDTMQKYQDIFSFLLLLKTTLFALNRLVLKAPGCYPNKDKRQSATPKAKRLMLLRFWLLYFLNCFHGYFMSRIFSSVSSDMQLIFADSANLDSVITGHGKFLSSLHEKCPLHAKLVPIKGILDRVLSIALSLYDMWHMNLADIEDCNISKLEMEYQRSHLFFLNIFKKVNERLSLSHLRGLSADLMSNIPNYD